VVLGPGQYGSLGEMGLNGRVSSVRATSADPRGGDRHQAAAAGAAQITFYELEGFRGRSFTTDKRRGNLERAGFNDRASSAEVHGERWEVCDGVRFQGRCVVLRPGRYPSLAAMSLNDRVSSVREVRHDARIADNRYAPMPGGKFDHAYRRRGNEQLYEANVTSVRAVVQTPQQRCWVEPGQVPQAETGVSVPGALVGALIGGILGHQVGNGSGNTIATVGGVAAGAAAGSQVGRLGGGQQTATEDVQRCEAVPGQARPEFWDVTYSFRSQEHRVQLTAPPGRTITVNEQGEPRV
jgi:uncharacterized protein YcfJ